MTEKELIQSAEERMQKTLHVLTQELASLRAGRANPQLLDRILVDYYGTPTAVNQLGNISAPEPRQLLISLWDQSIAGEVSKAILKSDLGLNPSVDGKMIRLMIPELTEERRKQLGKVIGKFGEEAKVAVRSIRRDANEQLKKGQKNGDMTEDEFHAAEKDTQKLTDKYIQSIDDMIKAKEKEIMEV